MALGISAARTSSAMAVPLSLSSLPRAATLPALALAPASCSFRGTRTLDAAGLGRNRAAFCRASRSETPDDYREKSANTRQDAANRLPQEDVLKAISELSRLRGRQSKTTNVVMGGTANPYGAGTDWLELDQKVNHYPSLRGFTAIGTGGDDFVQSMVLAVESVMQFSIPEDSVQKNISAKGNYISVKIGPLRVESSEQVQAVYQAMRLDSRMRYFL